MFFIPAFCFPQGCSETLFITLRGSLAALGPLIQNPELHAPTVRRNALALFLKTTLGFPSSIVRLLAETTWQRATFQRATFLLLWQPWASGGSADAGSLSRPAFHRAHFFPQRMGQLYVRVLGDLDQATDVLCSHSASGRHIIVIVSVRACIMSRKFVRHVEADVATYRGLHALGAHFVLWARPSCAYTPA